MQELLTKGIGYKEFKDAEIGRIPKEWEVVELGDDKIAEIRGNKIISDVQKVAFIPMELIPDNGIFVKYEISNLKGVSSSTYCEAGDLLLAKITPSLENGKQGIVPEDVPNGFALATTEVYPIVCKGIDRLFLFYVLKFPRFRKILEFSMRGTTGRQRVPKDAVERLKIPLPSYQEQKRIAETLSTFDKKLKIEGNEKAKLERIKQGLMDLLLTGKIRVKVN
jgi:type I restriction enzyme S subunit